MRSEKCIVRNSPAAIYQRQLIAIILPALHWEIPIKPLRLSSTQYSPVEKKLT